MDQIIAMREDIRAFTDNVLLDRLAVLIAQGLAPAESETVSWFMGSIWTATVDRAFPPVKWTSLKPDSEDSVLKLINEILARPTRRSIKSHA